MLAVVVSVRQGKDTFEDICGLSVKGRGKEKKGTVYWQVQVGGQMMGGRVGGQRVGGLERALR